MASKKFGTGSEKSVKCYNKMGIALLEDDIGLMSHGDVVYIALNGENFNYCAILDDYELGRTLGVGGFGKVLLGKSKETNKLVAIKFTDVSDQLTSANTIGAVYKEAESLKSLIHKHII